MSDEQPTPRYVVVEHTTRWSVMDRIGNKASGGGISDHATRARAEKVAARMNMEWSAKALIPELDPPPLSSPYTWPESERVTPEG